MGSERFDRFVRAFGQTRSRRQAVRSLAGAAAATLGLQRREASARRCRQNGRGCKSSDGDCCNGNCLINNGLGPANTCQGPLGTPCTADGQCESSICNTTYRICMQCLPENRISAGYCRRNAECCSGLTCNPFGTTGGSGLCFATG